MLVRKWNKTKQTNKRKNEGRRKKKKMNIISNNRVSASSTQTHVIRESMSNVHG